MNEHDESEARRLDELRRRLYRPGATDADRREYAALAERLEGRRQQEPEPPSPDREQEVAAQEIAEQPIPPGDSPLRRGPRRRAVLAVVVGGIAVLAVAVAATQLARRDGPSPVAVPTTASVWAGMSAPTPGAVPTPITLRPGDREIPAQQTYGGGSALVPLDLRSAPQGGGRLVVALSSSDPAPIGWLAERPSEGSHDANAFEVLATSPPALRADTMWPTVVAYTGAPPTRIVVRAPTGAGWTLTVIFAPMPTESPTPSP